MAECFRIRSARALDYLGADWVVIARVPGRPIAVDPCLPDSRRLKSEREDAIHPLARELGRKCAGGFRLLRIGDTK
jgi:hypothetical protein